MKEKNAGQGYEEGNSAESLTHASMATQIYVDDEKHFAVKKSNNFLLKVIKN